MPEDIENHCKAWKGRSLRTGHVFDVLKFETALGLIQGASQASQPGAAAAATRPPAANGGGGNSSKGASQAPQPGAAAAATGPPAADCGGGTASGGGGTDAQVIELTRTISALGAKIGQLEERNANLEDSLRSLNFNFS